MSSATVGDIEIYYEVHGDGTPVLAISGTGNDLRYSRPAHNPLNTSFQVAHFDQRGLGQTTVAEGPYTMAHYADDAAGLLDHLGWDRAHVVGTSFGGMVAQNLAVRHPDRIDRLVLACTSSGGVGGASANLLAYRDLPAEERVHVAMEGLDTRYDRASGDLPPGIADMMKMRAYVPTAAPGSEQERGEVLQLEARLSHDTYEAIASFDRPTLVIGGRYDGIAPPANLEAIAAQLPEAELVLCDGGHAFMLQDPSSWTTIMAFLELGAP